MLLVVSFVVNCSCILADHVYYYASDMIVVFNSQSFQELNFVARDGLTCLLTKINQIVYEKWLKLLDSTRTQVKTNSFIWKSYFQLIFTLECTYILSKKDRLNVYSYMFSNKARRNVYIYILCKTCPVMDWPGC